eukprot:1976305-Rhodomonas_salina.1
MGARAFGGQLISVFGRPMENLSGTFLREGKDERKEEEGAAAGGGGFEVVGRERAEAEVVGAGGGGREKGREEGGDLGGGEGRVG